APPVSGEANDAVCVLLAKCLGIPKRDVQVVSGEKSRDKIVSISGISPTRISEMLSSLNNKT
ncbi:MAG TPA: DUF167 domain-containing protein, partial [Flavobacteriales bacterium]|nr:DUF167 domain-containing protein [Flavobacteriales bacterium]